MPRGHSTKTPERVALALHMREKKGRLLKEIAAELGVSRSTVDAWLNDPDGQRARSRKDSYRGTCADCGGRTTGCNGRASASLRCRRCDATKNAERNAAIAAAYAAGEDTEVIAARHGLNPKAVHKLCSFLRERGEPIPLRRLSGSRTESHERHMKLIAAVDAGRPLADIARDLGYATEDSAKTALRRARRKVAA